MYTFNAPQTSHNLLSGDLVGSSTITQVVTPTEPPLSLELNYLVNNVADLEVTIGELAKRLDPLMVPGPPTAGTGATEKANTRGAVVDALAANNARLRLIRDRIASLQAALVV